MGDRRRTSCSDIGCGPGFCNLVGYDFTQENYLVHSLAEIIEVLDLVEKYCSGALQEFLRQCVISKYGSSTYTYDNLDAITSMTTPEDMARLITIARRLNIPNVLPLAFYALAIECPDPGYVDAIVEVLSVLSSEDQARLLIGVSRLYLEAARLMNISVENSCIWQCLHDPDSRLCPGLAPRDHGRSSSLEQYGKNPLTF